MNGKQLEIMEEMKKGNSVYEQMKGIVVIITHFFKKVQEITVFSMHEQYPIFYPLTLATKSFLCNKSCQFEREVK